VEPFRGAKITDDPGEVDLGESSGLRVIKIVHAVPNRFQDRSKRSDANASTNKQDRLIIQKILTRATKRTVDHDTGQRPVYSRVGNNAHDLGNVDDVRLPGTLGVKIATEGFRECLCKVTYYPDVDGDEVFFGGAGESERMPLKVRDFGTGKEDVLTGASSCFLFLDLEFHDVGRMLDHLGDEGDVPRSDFP